MSKKTAKYVGTIAKSETQDVRKYKLSPSYNRQGEPVKYVAVSHIKIVNYNEVIAIALPESTKDVIFEKNFIESTIIVGKSHAKCLRKLGYEVVK